MKKRHLALALIGLLAGGILVDAVLLQPWNPDGASSPSAVATGVATASATDATVTITRPTAPPPGTPLGTVAPRIVLPPGTWPDSKRSGIAEVDRVLDALMTRSADVTRSVLGSFEAPCIGRFGPVSPPGNLQWCDGDPVGTPVRWFYAAGTEASYFRAGEVPSELELVVPFGSRLFAVYRADGEASLGATYVAAFLLPVAPGNDPEVRRYLINETGLSGILYRDPLRFVTQSSKAFVVPPANDAASAPAQPTPKVITPADCDAATRFVVNTFGMDVRLEVSPSVVREGAWVSVHGADFPPGHYRFLAGTPNTSGLPSGETDVGSDGTLDYSFQFRWPYSPQSCLGIFARIGDGPIASTPLFLYVP